MAAMRVRQTPAGHEQYGAWREGEHDDLVFAVALAHWGAKSVASVSSKAAATTSITLRGFLPARSAAIRTLESRMMPTQS